MARFPYFRHIPPNHYGWQDNYGYQHYENVPDPSVHQGQYGTPPMQQSQPVNQVQTRQTSTVNQIPTRQTSTASPAQTHNMAQAPKTTAITSEQAPKKEDSNRALGKAKKDNHEEPLFELLGIQIYLDDIIILALLFLLYQEGVEDQMLYLTLVMLLFS